MRPNTRLARTLYAAGGGRGAGAGDGILKTCPMVSTAAPEEVTEPAPSGLPFQWADPWLHRGSTCRGRGAKPHRDERQGIAGGGAEVKGRRPIRNV